MKIATFKPLFVATGLAMGLALSASAFALPQFQVDPDSNPLTLNNFYATEINGGSSERLTINPGGPGVGSLSTSFGYLSFSGFSNTGPLGPLGPVAGIDSGLGVTHGLYLTFDLVATLATGTVGTVGSTYNILPGDLNFTVWKDVGFVNPLTRTTFTPATLGAEAGYAQFADDIMLGSGTSLVGLAGINALGGAFLNSSTTYANTAAGDAYFVDPVPFYTLAFNAFNNTGPGVSINATHVAINAAGVVDFNQVPEPATLALLGMGLIGMGVSLRKRKVA